MKKTDAKSASQTAGGQVYDYLRSEIVELRLKPGQMVSIKELSEHLKVSRSPVRDALIRLENEGLITPLPQRGTLISKIDTDRSNDERFLRICIEEKIVEMFLEVCTESDIRHLEENIAKQRICEQHLDIRGFLKLDDEFHGYFYRQTGKEFCFELVQNNVGHYNRIRLLSCMEKNMLANTIVQHEEIIRLIREKSKEQLLLTIRRHLQKIELDSAELKCKYPNLFSGAPDAAEKETPVLEHDFLASIAQPMK